MALSTVRTGCTSNPDTFRCYPYTTYNTSETRSSATFFWTIAQVNASAFNISTAPNPFVAQFSNVSLSVLNANQATERLTFSFPMTAAVVPTSAVGDNNAATTCYYNHTVMSATIWTRKPAEYPKNLTTPVSSADGSTLSSTTFDPWPYAVQLEQVQDAQDGPPDCRDDEGNPVGNFMVPAGGDAECSCDYANFGL
jgi:hypothetical protein